MIKTNISTLNCYNFDLNLDSTQNSSFLIEIEEKLSHETFIKWEEYKTKLKAKDERITTEKLLSFYEERIVREETAQYLRQKSTHEDTKTKTYTLNTMVKQSNKPIKRDTNQSAARVNYETKSKSTQYKRKGQTFTPQQTKESSNNLSKVLHLL